MKYIINEEQYDKLYLRRRLYAIDELIEYGMESIYGKSSSYYDVCDYDSNTFIDVVSEWIGERMYYDYFGDMDDASVEWAEIYQKIMDYVKIKHSNRIISLYNKICNKK